MWYTFLGVPAPSFFGWSSWDDRPGAEYLQSLVLFHSGFEVDGDLEFDIALMVQQVAAEVASDFAVLTIEDVRVEYGSVIVIVVLGSTIAPVSGLVVGGVLVGGIGLWAGKHVGGSALDQFGRRVGDRFYHLLPQKIRGKPRNSEVEAHDIAVAQSIEHGCFGVALSEGGRHVNDRIEYMYAFVPYKCGSVRIGIPVSGKAPAEVRFFGGGA